MEMAQFVCKTCGEGFEQKSRFERHLATNHPERAPSAADVEKALAGIQYPKSAHELAGHAAKNTSDRELMDLIKSLPERQYRDSVEVAIAIGEVKQRRGTRSAEQVAATEPPSVRGGKISTRAVSAAAVAKALSGIDFPRNKDRLKDYAKNTLPEWVSGTGTRCCG
jgi:hypothetical protein